jgi:carbamoyl-phosphate synthase large subunit
MTAAVAASGGAPVLIDAYLSRATEVDVDALCDGEDVFVAGVLEHIEEAGVHSGDSACSLPPFSLRPETIEELKRQTEAMARALNVRGLMNVQFAIEEPLSAAPRIFVLEVNPRASRTVPFVAKTVGKPIAAIAAKIMTGVPLASFNLVDTPYDHVAVKEAVFPFARFPGVDTVLGPEMRSTGEVMGLDWRRPGESLGPAFARAFAKSQLAGGAILPSSGGVFVSVKDADKPWIEAPVRLLLERGFRILATGGTHRRLTELGLAAELVKKVLEGRPHIVDAMKNGEVQLVFNTTEGRQSLEDSFSLRRAALMMKIPYYTTTAGANAAAQAIAAQADGPLEVRSLQSYSSPTSGEDSAIRGART